MTPSLRVFGAFGWSDNNRRSDPMALTTADALANLGLTVYRGPTQDRLSLREAHERGVLVWSVNRSHIFCKLGEPTVLGYYPTIEKAVEALKANPEYKRISAHHRGWGFVEECIVYSPTWKPLGEL
jgi:hypothetical protein